MKSYIVKEQHYGDKQYWPGDTREMEEYDAAPLLQLGLIAEAEAAAKAAEAEAAAKAAEAEAAAKADGKDLFDKAEKGAPKNKGAGNDNA